jgi:DNA polymerase-1
MIDYSQIELRLAAHYAQVQELMNTFINKGDPHQTTADLVGVERYIAKNLNFAWFYGAGPGKFCDMVEENGYDRPDERDAQRWFDQFGEAFPELIDWKFAVLRAGRRLGHVRTILGRRRHLPELDSFNSYERSRAERQAVNSVIQGSAGDIIKWAMLQIDPILDDYDAKMNDQVHDELGFTVPEDAVEEFAPVIQHHMESVEEHFNISVPIVAEPEIAQTWGEAKG